jgi:hypothetical protein
VSTHFISTLLFKAYVAHSASPTRLSMKRCLSASPSSSSHRFFSTKRTEVSKGALFNDYLRRREEILSLHHPQWDLTNEEISSSSDLLKRDGTPICIPPSWDLIQKYAGPINEGADGTGPKTPKLSNRFSGERVEAEFLAIFRNLKIGGVLVGGVNSEHFLNTEKFVENHFFPMPKEARDVFKQEMRETKG